MLVLNKRTVACLNNLEMQNIRGGDDEVLIPTRGICGDETIITKLIRELIVVVSLSPTMCH